jgi:hypothetical protein
MIMVDGDEVAGVGGRGAALAAVVFAKTGGTRIA